MKDHAVPSDHETVPVIIYQANIDRRIVPLISWLNSFHCIMTRWSCEGDKGGNPEYPPYVTVWIDTGVWPGKIPDEWKSVAAILRSCQGVKINCSSKGSVRVYNIDFDTHHDMLSVIQKIEQGYFQVE